jgi:hypothetical protein
MARRVFRAELETAPAGVIGIIEADDIVTLRKQVAKEFVPLLEDGDRIKIFETYED